MNDTNQHAPDFANSAVESAFAAFSAIVRPQLLQLRQLVFDTALQLPQVGRIDETLKWGQPAYLTPDTRSGSTIRLGTPKEGGFALYTHCQTTLIADFRHLAGDAFRYDGNRAVVFEGNEEPPLDLLRPLVASALTYHLKSR
ncbi:DUF1801 domain-containing protein [Qingshengfaniella alkalisoli]|uniref:DUF1801 domain-containing protein n=1 Tax=Qingshengfaniella alkalisoli TaxID=2599296 RepID=A0A5B8I504_9RHOB|nr:DUF1801 domain-containing protein [Qingshengfaniella alkalisoli]QDY68285.1 DUF1801 domain-containing protein [Qingshengfaniella alkalisoli]